MRLVDWLDRGAMIAPDRPCVVDDDVSFTYQEVVALTEGIAATLSMRGIGRGNRVAVYGPNSAAALVAVLGIARAGATWIPANTRSTLSELAAVLAVGRCSALIHDPTAWEAAKVLTTDVPSLTWTVSTSDLLSEARLKTAAMVDGPSDPRGEVILAFTGGTTGQPRAAVLSARNIEAFVTSFLAEVNIGQPPVFLAAAPLTHSAGALCFPVFAVGGTIVIQRGVDAPAIFEAIERHRVTFVMLPPTAIYVLLAHPSARSTDYSSLQAFVYVGAPMAPERVREAIEVFGPVMTQLYGQTEAPMICTVLTAEEHSAALDDDNPRRLSSCGRPSLAARVAVMDEGGLLVEQGGLGEVVVRGNLVMEGYLHDAAANEAAGLFGWHHTGDVGYFDEDGFLYLVDRTKDMIVTGGFNVFSSEVEQIVLSDPAVQQCAVIGVPDDKWGEAVTAVVELRPGSTIDAEGLIQRCKEALGSVKAPKRIEVWDSLPRSDVGKILKREIRSTYWEGRDRSI